MTQSGLMTTYNRLPVSFVKGEGAWLIDDAGKRYLDALSGIGVVCLGHAHPAVSKTIAEQAATLIHTSNVYRIPLQEQLGARLCEVSGMDTAFFGNSGAEANEAAIKIARLYGHNKGIENPAIIVMDGSFHGRTLATLTATGNRKVQAGFEPLVSGFVRAPFNDIEAIETIAQNNTSVVAILVEPIQGEGGINTPDDEYLDQLHAICEANDWLLMLDEIQTGNCRSGHYFAYQHGTQKPHVVTTAKGLGNGFPIGVCLAEGKAAAVFQPGNHGTTYGGNPLACATGLTVLETLVNENRADHAATMGARMREGFKTAFAGADYIKDIRGKGLMIGVELDRPCAELVKMCLEAGLLINVTNDSVIRLLPPLIISEAEADQIVDTVVAQIQAFIAK